MKRPIVYFLIYFIIGIIFGQHYYEFNYAVLFMLSVILSVIVVYFISTIKKSLLLILVYILGIFIGLNSTLPYDKNLYEIAQNNTEAEIICEVVDMTKEYEDCYRYIVKCEHIKTPELDIDVKSKGIVYDTDYFKAGDVINIKGKISPIAKKVNDTDFDSYSYYKSYGIEYKISSDEVSFINRRTNVNSLLKSVRNKFADNFDRLLYSKEAAFMKAVILGDRAELDDDFYQTFKDGGVAHIIAISGLHISIISGFMLYIIGKYRRNLSYTIVILFLIFYSVMSGLSPSVIRASIMTGILVIGKMLGRDYDIISSVSAACVILLFVNPFNIYNIGFEYSVMCVFGIGILIDILTKYKIHNPVVEVILISIIANIFAKPLTLYHFYYINIWDIISNIFIVPFMGLVIGFGITANLLSFISFEIGKIIISVPEMLIGFYESVCNFIISLPYYKINTGGISEIMFITIYLFYFVVYHSIMNIKNIVYLLIPSVISMFCYLCPESKIGYVDTDNNKCIVVSENNSCMLINCGSKYGLNYGKYRILNYLNYKNIDNIYCIYVTKTDYKHMGGILEICEYIKIEKIRIYNSCERNEIYYMLLEAAQENNIDIEII